MSIDPVQLAAQRIATGAVASPHLFLAVGTCGVCGGALQAGARKPVCRRCRNRALMTAAREKARTAPCACGVKLPPSNKSGQCRECWGKRLGQLRSRDYFRDGGGI